MSETGYSHRYMRFAANMPGKRVMRLADLTVRVARLGQLVRPQCKLAERIFTRHLAKSLALPV